MPSLIIIAGPNGAGKSTVSSEILKPYNITAFDFDKVFYERWKKFRYDPLVEGGVREYTMEFFQKHMNDSFENELNLSFETNFNSQGTLHHPRQAKMYDYKTELVFIGLESVDLAIQRVQNRVKHGGHFVDEVTIRERYYDGLKLLDSNFDLFDEVRIYESPPKYGHVIKCIEMTGEVKNLLHKPSFFEFLPQMQRVFSN